jgi:hypothetical protein
MEGFEFVDDQPHIHGYDEQIRFDISCAENPTNFNDRKGFVTKFNVEPVAIGELVSAHIGQCQFLCKPNQSKSKIK